MAGSDLEARILKSSLIAGTAIALLVAAWIGLGTPSSFAEWRFHRRLTNAAFGETPTLDLGTLMPGDWELVCSAHCYDGPFRLDKYQRTFPSVSACHDNSWGLVFIAPDGSHTSAAGDCRSSVRFDLDRCLPRQSAGVRLYRSQAGCSAYR